MNMSAVAKNYFDALEIEEFVFSHFLEKRASESPEAVFFTFEDQTHTLGDFNKAVNSMARCLMEQGVTHGSVVAVVMATSPEYLCLWFALAKIGAVEVPINSAYLGDILLHQLKTSGAEFCVVDDIFYENVNGVIKDSAVKTCFVRGAESRELSAPYMPFQQLQQMQDDSNLDITISYVDSCGIIFTSGTTGPSKGVLLSYRYLTAYGVMYADINKFQDDEVLMNFLPFFHLSGKFITIATLVSGGRMRLMPKLSISGFMEEVRIHGITHFLGVGGICNMLLTLPESPEDAASTIRTIYAVPDPDGPHHIIEKRFNCRMTTVFGSTEVGLPLFRSLDTGYR
ncbi:MAG: AMP-binding protein [Porticoccaceae bacterium]